MERSIIRLEAITAYGVPFIFCDRKTLPLWKGVRFGYDAHFNPRIDDYWMEMGYIERQAYFFTFSGYEDTRTIPPGFFWVVPHQLLEYYCSFSQTAWGIWHEKPIVNEHNVLLLESYEAVRQDVTIDISEEGAILFPGWMSGEDIVQYPVGVHKYTNKQEHADLVVLDLPPGIYAVDVFFPAGNIANEHALGFIMSKIG